MKSNSSRTPEGPERPGRRAAKEAALKVPRSGEGAASALASLKRIERDRASNKPGDGSKG